jgi:hypothetical protein
MDQPTKKSKVKSQKSKTKFRNEKLKSKIKNQKQLFVFSKNFFL